MKALRIDAVAAKTGLARKTIEKWVAADRFPKSFRLSPKCTVWDEADIDNWLLTKKKEAQYGSHS